MSEEEVIHPTGGLEGYKILTILVVLVIHPTGGLEERKAWALLS